MNRYKRSARALLATLAVYALLVATNLGEFWPFSIYPMFSQGGIPWSRSVVRELPTEGISADEFQWDAVGLDELPGEAYPLAEHGIDHIDLANFVSKTRVWDDARVAGLRRMFGQSELERRSLLVMRAQGRITEDDSVRIEFTPYVLLTAEESVLNEELVRSQ